MRNGFKWAAISAVALVLMATPVLAKKADVKRTVVAGVTLAEVKPGSQVTPYYPATARVSSADASVVLAVQVHADGRVGEVELVEVSAPELGFEMSAMDAVKQWRFLPALKDGEAIETLTLVRLSFTPPTMRFPDGMVFTEASPRPYGAPVFGAVDYKAMTDGFRLTSHGGADAFSVAEGPNCNPGGGKCMYDRGALAQFNKTLEVTPPTLNPESGPVRRR